MILIWCVLGVVAMYVFMFFQMLYIYFSLAYICHICMKKQVEIHIDLIEMHVFQNLNSQ